FARAFPASTRSLRPLLHSGREPLGHVRRRRAGAVRRRRRRRRAAAGRRARDRADVPHRARPLDVARGSRLDVARGMRAGDPLRRGAAPMTTIYTLHFVLLAALVGAVAWLVWLARIHDRG